MEFAEITLNLLRGSALNPTISAYHQVNGKFTWSATPLAPFGTKVVIHELERGSWDIHGVDGWAKAPAMRHYRCQNVLVRDTLRVRVTDTLAWHPTAFVLPGGSPMEIFCNTADNLIASIKQLSKLNPLLLDERQLQPISATLTDALLEFRQIFHSQQAEAAVDSNSNGQQAKTTGNSSEGGGATQQECRFQCRRT